MIKPEEFVNRCIYLALVVLLLVLFYIRYDLDGSTGNLISLLSQAGRHSLSCANYTTSTKLDEENSKIKTLLDLWSNLLNPTTLNTSLDIPNAPHLEDCKKCNQVYTKLDSRGADGKQPHWTLWKGLLGIELGDKFPLLGDDLNDEMLLGTRFINSTQGPYPPWVKGSDEDNLPLTRRVQRDIWLHQHPKDCKNAKFLMAHWHGETGLVGVGSELASTSAMLGEALILDRVFVTKPYHGANHEGCNGPNHARWSCYFVPEASEECIARAMELSKYEDAWKNGTLVTYSGHNNNGFLWGDVPSLWGKPWEANQKTVDINGKLMTDYGDRPEARRWWKAQAFRYLMRYPSEYLCNLLNRARHEAFGVKAAEMVVKVLPRDWPQVKSQYTPSDVERIVWSSFGPWIPRPLVSVHVRQGDKAREMELHPFDDYMKLADKLKRAFPNVQDIWLSTEMQNVIEESKNYTNWKFYYTNNTRQTGDTSMKDYMAKLGKRVAFDTAYVNMMMSLDCDFFIGPLGSSWDYLLDCMRVTNGKVMAGYLSVNGMNRFL